MRIPRRNVLSVGILRLPEPSPLPGLFQRIAWACGIILVVAVFLWFDRDGLRDNAHPDRPMGFSDVLYFTVVSLTTVGYGDITPVTETARLINAILLTPVRVFLWALFLGTAYELTVQRYRERVQMDQLRQRLKNHVIICGYGVKGRAIVAELLAHGHKPENIVIIEPSETEAHEAAAQGLVALTGDASAEAILQAAAIEKASHILAAPNRDDVCVLICLTVRAVAPKIRLIASAREEENVKLLYRAGADLVIAPSVSGGRLMAAAVRQVAVPEFLEDILHFGHGVDAAERTVRPEEAGKLVSELSGLAGALVLGVKRGETRCPFHVLKQFRLQAGDVIVYLICASDCVITPEKGEGNDAVAEPAASETP
jgi:voltage-gated potassium channel